MTQQITATPTPLTSDKLNDTERLAVFNQAMQNLRSTAVKCEMREVSNVAEYLEKHAVPYRPMPNGHVTPIETKQKDQWFALIGLLPDDYNMAKWAPLRDAPFAASYQPDNDVMTWRPGTLSAIWESILLLHEGFHLTQYRKRRYNWHDKRIFCIEEVRTHEFQNKIMLKLGGKRYQALIQSVADKAISETKKRKLTGTDYAFCEPNPAWTLEEYFGPCNGVFEKNARITHTWIAMAFQTIDQLPAIKDKQEAKAMLLFNRYEKSGVLPQ